MNSPIRRLAVVAFLMFTALLISTTYIQFVTADELRERPENRRTLLSTYSRDRGPILVDGQPIAQSEPTSDELRRIRVYPQGEEYAHVTGYFSFIYGADGGLEGAANGELAGTADTLFYRRLVDLVTGTEPRGASLELTLDADMQRAAAQALGDRRGAVVALDVSTGAVLAMVSHPTYDPNALASHRLGSVEQAWAELTGDPANPMVNRAIAGDTYPPGSVFKLVVTAAALESGRYNAESQLEAPLTYTLPGTSTSIPNFGGSRCGPADEVSLADALRVSCNTSYAWLANELGDDALREQAQAFGFGQSWEIPMTTTASRYPDEPDDAQTALTGIGQHDVRVTPLQIAMISAAIANEGVAMEPYLVGVVRDQDLNAVSRTTPQELGQAISSQTARELTDMMVQVVENGTGTNAAIPGIQVAGKTGTAEYSSSGAAHAWFTGFAPANNPSVAVAVVVESASQDWTGETGGSVAAPIAQAVLEAGVNR